MSTQLICPTCGDLARLTDAVEVYAGRFGGKEDKLWCCRNFPFCRAYVGCVRGTTQAHGTLAGPDTRLARRKAHERVDRLWKTEEQRSRIYVRMEQEFGFEVHMGSSDVVQCRAIIEWANKQKKEKSE